MILTGFPAHNHQEVLRHCERNEWVQLVSVGLQKQKSVNGMQGLLNKMSKRCELVAGLYSGESATVKPCSKILRHYPFVSCNIDGNCFEASTKATVVAYTRESLKEKPYASGTNKMMVACERVVQALNPF